MKNHFFILLIFFSSASAQKVSIDSLLIGAWKGTSICQIKPSACNDEIAVYHVSKGNQPNIYHIVMNKVINEEEEGMAVYDYTFNAADNSLFCYDNRHDITWKFIVKGNNMEGTLTSGNKLYRVIKMKKENGH